MKFLLVFFLGHTVKKAVERPRGGSRLIISGVEDDKTETVSTLALKNVNRSSI